MLCGLQKLSPNKIRVRKSSPRLIVIQKGRRVTAIEVKSGRLKRLGGSMAFLKEFPEAMSLVVGSQSITPEAFLSGEVPLFKE